ncbi:hypothetical protein GJ496_006563 [Pomphorhynchus laevis]|nr:hypothetical protein GJ496_006563 [Pomphorhynchus laevis]
MKKGRKIIRFKEPKQNTRSLFAQTLFSNDSDQFNIEQMMTNISNPVNSDASISTDDDELEAELLRLEGNTASSVKPVQPRNDKKKLPPGVNMDLLQLDFNKILNDDEISDVDEDDETEPSEDLLAELHSLLPEQNDSGNQNSKIFTEIAKVQDNKIDCLTDSLRQSELPLVSRDVHNTLEGEDENKIETVIAKRIADYDAAIARCDDNTRRQRLQRQRKILDKFNAKIKNNEKVDADELPPIPASHMKVNVGSNHNLPISVGINPISVKSERQHSHPTHADIQIFDQLSISSLTSHDECNVKSDKSFQNSAESGNELIEHSPSTAPELLITSKIDTADHDVSNNKRKSTESSLNASLAEVSTPSENVSTSLPKIFPQLSLQSTDRESINPINVEKEEQLICLNMPNNSELKDALIKTRDEFGRKMMEAKNQSDASKYRRLTRILKQYDKAIISCEKGICYDFSSLPEPYGYPPLPVSKIISPPALSNLTQAGQSDTNDLILKYKRMAIQYKNQGNLIAAKQYLIKAKTLEQQNRPQNILKSTSLEKETQKPNAQTSFATRYNSLQNGLEQQLIKLNAIESISYLVAKHPSLSAKTAMWINLIKQCSEHGYAAPFPKYHLEECEIVGCDIPENQLCITIKSLPTDMYNPTSYFFKISVPLPTFEKQQILDSKRLTENKFVFEINRRDTRLRRGLARREIKFQLVRRPSLLNWNERIEGTGSVKMSVLEEHSVHSCSVNLLSGRKNVLLIECLLQVRYPLNKQVPSKESFIFIDEWTMGENASLNKMPTISNLLRKSLDVKSMPCESLKLLDHRSHLIQDKIMTLKNSSTNEVAVKTLNELQRRLDELTTYKNDIISNLKLNGKEAIQQHLSNLKSITVKLKNDKLKCEKVSDESGVNQVQKNIDLIEEEIDVFSR